MTGSLRTLLVTLGSHGDLRPLLAIGVEAIRRGGAATMLTSPHFEPEARRRGIEVIPFGPPESVRDWVSRRPATMDAMRGPLTMLRDVIAPRTASLVTATLEAIDRSGPDVVVAHQACIGVRWACERAGVPYVDAALSPCAWMNPRDTLSLTPWRGRAPTRRAVRFDVWIGRRLTGWLSDGPFNLARRSLGLRPVRHVWFDELGASCMHLGLWSPSVRASLEGDPPDSIVTGFARLDDGHDEHEAHDGHDGHDGPLSGDLRRFLDAGSPPVVVTLGTAVTHAQPGFHAMVAEALSDTGVRVVLVTGDADYVPPRLPASVFGASRVPFRALFPRASLVVHHGGIGTCAEAMAAGVPSLILPAAHDQFDNAARCERLGVATTLHLRTVETTRLRKAVLEAAGNATMRARAGELAERVGGESGAAIAMDAIAARLGRRLTRESRPACRC
ncbi:MAG: glycosyltransferase [Phycisphaerae bacterium]|jgi:UDP:flavonoid glycosyltransferase YjiC (YdhE family)